MFLQKSLDWLETNDIPSGDAHKILKVLKHFAVDGATTSVFFASLKKNVCAEWNVITKEPLAYETRMAENFLFNALKATVRECEGRAESSEREDCEAFSQFFTGLLDTVKPNKTPKGMLLPKDSLMHLCEVFGLDVPTFVDLTLGSNHTHWMGHKWSYDQLRHAVEGVRLEPPDEDPKNEGVSAAWLVEMYGLESLFFPKEPSEKIQKAINHLADGLETLANALKLQGDDRKKIGFYGKLAIRVGMASTTDDCTGYCTIIQEKPLIYLDGVTGWTALAHEWFHALDGMLGLEVSKNGEAELLSKLITKAEHQDNLLGKSIGRVIDSFDGARTNADVSESMMEVAAHIKNGYLDRFIIPRLAVVEKEILSSRLDEWLDCVKTSTVKTDRENLTKSLNDILKSSPLKRYVAYIETELDFAFEAAKRMETEKIVSEFKRFAVAADHRMETQKTVTITGEKYTQSREEMLARSFETAFIGTFVTSTGRLAPALTLADNPVKLYPQGNEKEAQFKVWERELPQMLAGVKKTPTIKGVGLDVVFRSADASNDEAYVKRALSI